MLLKERNNMKRTYTDQNPREIEFLAKIGDRELTPEEVKKLQRIRQNARQGEWKKQNRDRILLETPKGGKLKAKILADEFDLGLYDTIYSLIDNAWLKSSSYRAVLELYNHLDLSSDSIDADLASDRLKMAKIKGKDAWVYEDKGGIYSDGTRLLSADEIKG